MGRGSNLRAGGKFAGGVQTRNLWTYRLNFDGPSGLTHSTFLLAGSVIHIRINCDPARCWVGRAPWSIAAATVKRRRRAQRLQRRQRRAFPRPESPPFHPPTKHSALAYRQALHQGGNRRRPGRSTGRTYPAGVGQEPADPLDPGHSSARAFRLLISVSGANRLPTYSEAHVGFQLRCFHDSDRRGVQARSFPAISSSLNLGATGPRLVSAELREKLSSPELVISFAGLTWRGFGDAEEEL